MGYMHTVRLITGAMRFHSKLKIYMRYPRQLSYIPPNQDVFTTKCGDIDIIQLCVYSKIMQLSECS
jgi:hypothetical protein